MWHCYLINFLCQWAKPDPLKPLPYFLWTELITQLEAVPVLFVPAFWAQERSITTRKSSLPMSSPSYSAKDSCLRVRRTCKFRQRPWPLFSPSTEGPCGHCAEGKAQLLPLWRWPGDLRQPTLPPQGWGKDYQGPRFHLLACCPTLPQTFPPSQPAAEEGFWKAGSLHSSDLQPDSMWSCTVSLGKWSITGKALVRGESRNFFSWSHY